jgi:hypothetical protein
MPIPRTARFPVTFDPRFFCKELSKELTQKTNQQQKGNYHMKRSLVKAITAGLLSLATLAAVTLPARAEDAHRFSAVYNNTFALTPDATLPANVLGKDITGKGFNTLLGETTVHFVGTIDLNTTPFPIVGVTTIKDADGDELYATTTGTVTPAKHDPTLVRLDYDYVFTGGTGKFRRASGRAHVFGCAVFQTALTGTASWCMEGRLSLRSKDAEGKD